MKIIISFWMLVLMGSCALAPMSSVKTARPLGKGGFQVNAGAEGNYSLFGGYGVNEELDVGLLFESGVSSHYGVWSKYSFQSNEENGASFALYGGASIYSGLSGGKTFFIGPIYSYKWSTFEFFAIARFNHVSWNAGVIDLDDEDKDDLIIDDIDYLKGSLNYLQADTGFNIWFKPTFAINATAKLFYFPDSEDSAASFGLNALFRFNKN